MDVQALRDLARKADEMAGQTRLVATDVAAAKGVDWKSTRAQQYRDDLESEARAVHKAADELSDAARALRGHADDVQRNLDRLAALRDGFLGALEDARKTLAGGVEDLSDATVDGARKLVDLARHMPSPGSLGWGKFW